MADTDNRALDGDTKGSREDDLAVLNEDDPTLLVRTEVRRGSLLGNVRVRLVRPGRTSFRRIGIGLLEATEATQEPHSMLEHIKRLLIGAHMLGFGGGTAWFGDDSQQAEAKRILDVPRERGARSVVAKTTH